MNWLRKIGKQIATFFESERGKSISKVLNRIIQILIFGFLGYQVLQIGWRDFTANLPLNPLFYVIVLINYFLLPVSEIFTYKISWPISAKAGLPIFIKKRVLNKDVIGYSGEIQLFAWVQKNLKVSHTEAFKVIKDNNILSSLASTFIVFGLLITFLLSGQITLLDYLENSNPVVYISAIVFVLILLAVLYRYRKLIFSMSRKLAIPVLGIHMGRFILANFFQVLLWSIILPEVPITVWFTYLSFSLIVSRIPFIPNSDFLFIGFSIEAADLLSVSSAEIAGLFVTQSIMDKLLNAVFYLIFSSRKY
jgi:hypothetical protein